MLHLRSGFRSRHSFLLSLNSMLTHVQIAQRTILLVVFSWSWNLFLHGEICTLGFSKWIRRPCLPPLDQPMWKQESAKVSRAIHQELPFQAYSEGLIAEGEHKIFDGESAKALVNLVVGAVTKPVSFLVAFWDFLRRTSRLGVFFRAGLLRCWPLPGFSSWRLDPLSGFSGSLLLG